MATIVTRAGKGSELLNTEMDANFVNLNNDKLEISAFDANTLLYATSDNTPEPKTINQFSDVFFAQNHYLDDNLIYARGSYASPDNNHSIGWDSTINGWKLQSFGGVEISNHLFIAGNKTRTLNYGYLSSSGGTGTGSGSNFYSIYTDHRIAASEFNAHSDVRIKDVKCISDSCLDIEILMSIEITDYVYKETGQKSKKVIAQQVEQHFPQCVTEIQKYIPDILRDAEHIENLAETSVITLSSHGLSAGDFVEIESSASNSKNHLEILESTSDTFTVEGRFPDVFVVGRRVDDFRVVDYDAISMLAVSALQNEIKKRKKIEDRLDAIEKMLISKGKK